MATAKVPTRQDLIEQLSTAISAFNRHRVTILQTALNGPGGTAEVERLEAEYDTLRDARGELRNRQLAENDEQYVDLARRAAAETKALTRTINNLAATAQIITAFATVIDIIGRIVLVAGI